MEQETGNKKGSEYKRKEVGENDEQWPTPALCACVLHLPHMTLTFTSWPPLLKYLSSFLTEVKMTKEGRKGNLTFNWKNITLLTVKTVPLRSVPELDTRVCAHEGTYLQSRETEPPTRPREKRGEPEALTLGPCLTSGIGYWRSLEFRSQREKICCFSPAAG